MKLETLHSEWEKDSQLDFSQPDVVMRNVPLLHARYWRYYTDEKQRYVAVKQEYDTLRHTKFEYFAGRLDEAERLKRGWPQQPLRLVKQEIDNYLNSDADLMPLSARVEVAELKLKFLEDAIKHINGRSFLVNSFIQYLKFSQGA